MQPVPGHARNVNTTSATSNSQLRSSPPLSNTRTSLLGIPPELRHQILQELFTKITIDITWRTTRHDTEWQPMLAILSTCRTLREEATAVLQANLTLTVFEEPARGNKHIPARISLSTMPRVITNNVHTFISHTEPLAHLQCYLDLFPVAKRIEIWTNVALQHVPREISQILGEATDTNSLGITATETIADEVLRFCRSGDDVLYAQFEGWTLGEWGWSQNGCVWQTTKFRRHQHRELLRPLRRSHRRPCWRPPPQWRECEFRVLFEVSMTALTYNIGGAVYFAIMIDPIRQCIADRYVLFQKWSQRKMRETWIPGREVLLVEEGLQDAWSVEGLIGLLNAENDLPKQVLWAPRYGLFHGLGQIGWQGLVEMDRIFEDQELTEMFMASAKRCG